MTVGPGNLRRLSVIYDRPIPFRFPLVLVLSIVCLVLPAWADFETAMDAYNRKDYATALREWQALAEQGEADAQDFLGTLHCKGWGAAGLLEGTTVVGESRRAGKRECAERSWAALCQRAGWIPGLGQAYMWSSLAAGSGYEISTGYRNDLAKQMTPAQIAEAQRLAREWKPLKK